MAGEKHGDVNTLGQMWCEIHGAWVDVEDRHLDSAFRYGVGPFRDGRPPLLREIPHLVGVAPWVPPDED